jgi:hypothetical protein
VTEYFAHPTLFIFIKKTLAERSLCDKKLTAGLFYLIGFSKISFSKKSQKSGAPFDFTYLFRIYYMGVPDYAVR